MAHSLESRVPFVTSRMAAFALSLPDQLLIDDDGRTKAVLRDALVGLVPQPVLDRREKIGFQPPDASWFEACEDWADVALEEASGLTGSPIDVSGLKTAIAQRRRAGKSADDRAQGHGGEARESIRSDGIYRSSRSNPARHSLSFADTIPPEQRGLAVVTRPPIPVWRHRVPYGIGRTATWAILFLDCC